MSEFVKIEPDNECGVFPIRNEEIRPTKLLLPVGGGLLAEFKIPQDCDVLEFAREKLKAITGAK